MAAKRTGEKYDAIIDAAVRVIAQFGYHQAQVSKIAREAKVADGTIYLYFENKDDVLISLFNEKMGAFISDMEQSLSEVPTPDQQLRELIRLHFEYLVGDQQLAIVTQIELRQSNPDVRREIGWILKKYLNVIDQVLIFGVEKGLFGQDLNVRTARNMIFGTIDETVTSWIMNDCKFNLMDQVEPIHRLFLKGLQN
ncbi:TetR/AcrR family transcriptional regulator [Marininema halotolerans]|uniref:TetR/AcrR family transcriptional regulator, fatty acid metabolism regulator protein n=1 Tax=Marininema halotolerans TaxID=1155944 RepID=A0A1I6S7N2_9BACL|nr:TetR/AcrR family transcriptional regulator [Marininema halotolerans]SFS72913.1 TetR/AcrR family transcriptional regulator, fatty acid metabolism regulator protein [Marininema halotolerans]